MPDFYVTIAANQPKGAGYYRIVAKDRDEARTLAFRHIPEGRWSMLYDTLAEVHPFDRKCHGIIGGGA